MKFDTAGALRRGTVIGEYFAQGTVGPHRFAAAVAEAVGVFVLTAHQAVHHGIHALFLYQGTQVGAYPFPRVTQLLARHQVGVHRGVSRPRGWKFVKRQAVATQVHVVLVASSQVCHAPRVDRVYQQRGAIPRQQVAAGAANPVRLHPGTGIALDSVHT